MKSKHGFMCNLNGLSLNLFYSYGQIESAVGNKDAFKLGKGIFIQ